MVQLWYLQLIYHLFEKLRVIYTLTKIPAC